MSPPLSIKNKTLRTLSIQQKSCKTGHRYLGIRLAPDGNSDDEFTFRLHESEQFNSYLLKAHLTPAEAEIFHNQIWLPKINYALAHTTFTEKQCNTIQSQYLPTYLNKLGYNQHYPRSIVFGEFSKGGLDITPLYTAQTITQIETLITSFRHKTQFSSLVNISLQLLQLEAGSNAPVLSYNPGDLSFLTPTWLTSIWRACISHNINIHIPNITIQDKQRENDTHIMDSLTEDYTNTQLQSINRCRLWMHVTTLSDITDDSGLALKNWAIKGNKQLDTTIEWPTSKNQQKKIGQHGNPPSFTIDGTLKKPLGKWIQMKKNIRTFTAFLNTEQKKLYITNKDITNTYIEIESNTYNMTPSSTQPIFQPGIRSKVKKINNYQVKITTRQLFKTDIQDKQSLKSIYQTVFPKELQQILGNIHFPIDDGLSISKSLQTSSLRGGSDGSLKNHISSYGYVIMGNCQKTSIYGSCKCPPSANEESSLRAELHGSYALLLCLKLIQIRYNISSGSCQIYIDNTTAISRLNGTIESRLSLRKTFLRPEFNLEYIIKRLKETIKIKITATWIRSHTTRSSTANKINNFADTLAKKGQQEHYLAPYLNHIQENILPTVILSGREITAHFHHTIKKQTSRKRIKSYHNAKNFPKLLQDIGQQWSDICVCSTNLTRYENKFSSKLLHRWLPTRTILFRNTNDSQTCPTCKNLPESNRHFISCSTRRFPDQWKKLKTTLILNNVTKEICYYLHQTLLDKTIVPNCYQLHNDTHKWLIQILTMTGPINLALGIIPDEIYNINANISLERQPTDMSVESKWKTQLSTHLKSNTIQLWHLHNAALHNSTQTDPSFSHQQMIYRMNKERSKCMSQLSISDSFLLAPTHMARVSQSVECILQWFRAIQVAKIKFKRSISKNIGYHRITDFFHPI